MIQNANGNCWLWPSFSMNAWIEKSCPCRFHGSLRNYKDNSFIQCHFWKFWLSKRWNKSEPFKKSFSIIPVVKTSTYKFPKSNIHRPQASKQIGLWRYYTYSCTVSNLKSLLLKVYETNLNNLPWRYRPCTIFSRPAVSSAVSPLQRGNVESRQHECLQSESHRTAGNLDQPEMEIVFYLRYIYPTKKKKKKKRIQ